MITFAIECPYCNGYAYTEEGSILRYRDKCLIKCERCGEIFYLQIDWVYSTSKPKIHKARREMELGHTAVVATKKEADA